MGGKCEGVSQEDIKEIWGGQITKHECEQMGGKYVPDDTGTCFVRDVLTRSMGEVMLELGATYPTARTFRDDVLAPTEVGSRFLGDYYAYLEDTVNIVRDDLALIGEFANAWLALLPWTESLVRFVESEDERLTDEKGEVVRFSEQMHSVFVAMIDEFKRRAPTERYASIMSDIIEEAGLYRGANAAEALRLLRRNDSVRQLH